MKPHEIVRHVRHFFDVERFRTRISMIDWTDYYKLEDIDLINDSFCKKFLEVLDQEAPIKVVQQRFF